ncbi:helix-turn-helix domain-containing protein [Lentilactobacillus hilgardii]|nr:helix-turn-helix domain-containing protein [Lentilactobacillus hilgardii]MCV3742968.1 helix-turn-helix domain-containing protein [Lentilactobacillus hilgardii]
MDEDLIARINDLLDNASSPRYLKIQEAPEYVNVDPQTFRRWRKAGLVKVIAIGGVKRVDRRDLDKLMDAHKY